VSDSPFETRPFGRTGALLPCLGLGCQRLVGTSNCSADDAHRILETAYELGIRYFDTAWVYGLGQAEERLGRFARTNRDSIWIATKTTDRTANGALRQLEESLTRLQTDHVDEWRLHNLSSLDDLDECFRPEGVIHAALRAREQGLTRYVGISGHTHPRVLIEALKRFPFDSAMFPGSVLDHFVHSFEDEFLAVANAGGVATVAMKVLGGGKLRPWPRTALRYTMGLPVSMVLAGCSRVEELVELAEGAEHFVALGDEERLEFLENVRPLVTPRNVPWRAVDWGKAGTWIEG
jgi:aryl-alcohol dehydrogenase-like predicted oxidoreductase